MKYESIEHVPRPLSKIICGCSMPAMQRGENVDELLDAVLAQGITTFDTAENYGKSEISLGGWLGRRNNREQVVLITKGCHPRDGKDRVTPEDLKCDIEQSFRQLGTDFIDIYLLHRDDLHVPVGPLVEMLNEYHRAGKLGAFGGSNWSIKRIEEAEIYAREHGLMPFTVSSPNFSLCEQKEDPWGGSAGGLSIAGPENEDARSWYREHEMPVLAYSSLGHGMLSGKVKSTDPDGALKILDKFAIKGYYCPENFECLARVEQLAEKKGCTVPQIALAWVLHQDFRVFPIVCSSRIETTASNASAVDISLTQSEVHWLETGET